MVPHELTGLLVPIISLTLGISMVIVAIVTKHRRQMQELELRHRERMAAIEKGLDLPPDPTAQLVESARKVSGSAGGSRYLLRGLVWLGVGLAIALSEGDGLFGGRSGVYGWVAAAVGVAYLIYYFVEGRREAPPPGDGGPRT